MTIKKVIYLVSSSFLGLLLATIAHVIIEILVIKYSNEITWYTYLGNSLCALPPIIFYGLWIIGLISGLFMGRYWWKIVYIEKRHWRFKKSN